MEIKTVLAAAVLAGAHYAAHALGASVLIAGLVVFLGYLAIRETVDN